MDVIHKPYHESHKESLLNLLKYMWSSLSKDEISKRFEWRYINNYCMDRGTVYIAVKDEKVVGFRGFTAQIFLFKGIRKIVLTPSDAIVHPDYRRLGLFQNLTNYALDSLAALNEELGLSVYLNLSSNEKSAPGNLKLGWQEFCEKKWYTKVFWGNLGSLFAAHSKLDFRKYRFGKRTVVVYNKIEAGIIASIRHFADYAIVREQSQDYYDWRYGEQSDVYFVVLKEAVVCKAFAIVEKNSGKSCYLYDYAAESGQDLTFLLNKIGAIMKVMAMRLLIIGGKEEEIRAIKKNGFFGDLKIMDSIRGKKKTPVLIKQVKLESNDDMEGINWRLPENWRIVRGDIH